MKKNECYRIEITDLNNLGFGVGRVAGQVVFVGGTVDGDVVTARIIRTAPSYAVGRVEEFHTRSPHRIEDTPCPAVGCGGCAYRYITREHEVELKTASVAAAFRRHALPVEIEGLVSVGPRYGYRNKAQYPVAPKRGGGLTVGFFAPKSHRVVEASGCPLQDPAFAPIVRRATALCEQYGLSAYDEESGTGLLRHFYLRSARRTGEILFIFVIAQKNMPHGEEIAATLRAEFPALCGVLVNINEEKTNVICGEEYRVLSGKGEMTDILCDLRLTVAPASFYQVNRDTAEALYRHARALACLSGKELLLDLFCGAGSIGLSMADGVREVIGIEVVEEAVECARHNAAQNGIENASFYCGDAADIENLLASAEAARGEKIIPDVVVLDPPRKGCDGRLLDFLLKLAPPRIVYISCNPDTLARDARHLTRGGYTMSPVTPFDLFPCTGHVESVVCLTRRRDN